MEIKIRKIGVHDATPVKELSKQLGYQLSLEQTIENIQTIISSENDSLFGALVENKLVGWIHAFKATRVESKPFVEIGGLVVDETHRGKGIGKQLIEAVKDWCTEKNVLVLRVRTNVKRTNTHRFYESAGFNLSKEQKIFEKAL